MARCHDGPSSDRCDPGTECLGVVRHLAGRQHPLGHPEEASIWRRPPGLVHHDRPLVVDLIELTIDHGVFVVRAAQNLAEADTSADVRSLVDGHPRVGWLPGRRLRDSTRRLPRCSANRAAARSLRRVGPRDQRHASAVTGRTVKSARVAARSASCAGLDSAWSPGLNARSSTRVGAAQRARPRPVRASDQGVMPIAHAG